MSLKINDDKGTVQVIGEFQRENMENVKVSGKELEEMEKFKYL